MKAMNSPIYANIIDGNVSIDSSPRACDLSGLADRFDSIVIRDDVAYGVKDGTQFGIDREAVEAELRAAWSAAG